MAASAGNELGTARVLSGIGLPTMLSLEPLVDRFVAQILGLLREATVGELVELRAANGGPGRRPKRGSRRPLKPPRQPSASELAIPAQEITDPSAVLEGVSRPKKEDEEEALAAETPAQIMTAPARSTASPRLRAGETVVRATSAGFVIRRRGQRRSSPSEPDAAASALDDAARALEYIAELDAIARGDEWAAAPSPPTEPAADELNRSHGSIGARRAVFSAPIRALFT
jgi:hypothetical protein